MILHENVAEQRRIEKTCKMEFFEKINSGFQPLPNFAKNFFLDVTRF